MNRDNGAYSLQHMSASLDSLTGALRQTPNFEYPILRQSSLCRTSTGDFDPQRLERLKEKGVFPYEVFTSVEALQNIKEFPPREAFYSSLTESILVTEEDYAFAKETYTYFGCSNLLDYLLLYNLTDVSDASTAMTNECR